MIKVKRKVAFQGDAHKRRDAARDARVKLAQSGRIPRIAKLLALASRPAAPSAGYSGGAALLAGSNPGEIADS